MGNDEARQTMADAAYDRFATGLTVAAAAAGVAGVLRQVAGA
jgi:hypothetical protein